MSDRLILTWLNNAGREIASARLLFTDPLKASQAFSDALEALTITADEQTVKGEQNG